MKKLCQSSFFQALAFGFLFMLPFTNFWKPALTWTLSFIAMFTFALLAIFFAESAKKELGFEGKSFQRIYRRFGIASVAAAVLAIFGICGLFIAAGMGEIVSHYTAETPSNLLQPIVDFFYAYGKYSIFLLFAFLIIGTALLTTSEFRTFLLLRKLGGTQKIGFRALRLTWIFALSTRFAGIFYFIYLQYYSVILGYDLTQQPRDFLKNMGFVGVFFAVQLLLLGMLMRTTDFLEPHLDGTYVPEDDDADVSETIEMFAPLDVDDED